VKATEEFALQPEELEEIRRTFFDQGRHALDALSQGLLSIEGEVPDEARLRPLWRAAHTLKGDCASVGFPDLSRLAHALEDALVAVQQNRRAVTSDQSDVLLSAVDRLHIGLSAGASGDPLPKVDDLVSALAGFATAPEPAALPDAVAEDARVRLAEAASRGRTVVCLVVTPRAARRDPRKVAREVAVQLGVEVVSEGRHTREGERTTEVLGTSERPLDALQAEAAALRSASVEVRPLQLRAAPVEVSLRESSRDGETVRVEARRVDEVLNLVGEMVTARSTIAGVAAEAEPYLSEELAARLADAQSLLGRVLQDLQRSAMRMRMVPVDRVFRRFSRVVRDLGRRTGKRLLLRIEGEGTELDRGILDTLEEPLMHLLRNAADHGVESPEARKAAGKSEAGHITLRASREGNQILIEVSDDGRGIDPAAVKRAAVEKGVVTEAEAAVLSDDDALQLVFRPGLSTARQVTETSGRGVGLDVVREKVEGLKGSILAANLPGAGASFVMKVPLTVAIIKALLFRVGGQDLAVPLTAVVEIAAVAALNLQSVGAQEVFRLRDAALGLVHVGPLLGLADVAPGAGYVVVLRGGGGSFGILVDALLGEQELVIKAVHDRWVRTPLVAGASVLGGGSLALILDVPSIHRAALSRGVPVHG
jgi:two-component system chemotaxis sensor kinase CheA